MRIALIGTHNSGKTTLLNLMKIDKMFDGYIFEGEKIREIHNLGFGINEEAKDDTQLALALTHFATINLHKNRPNLVLDRCLLDNYIYAKYLYNKGIVSKKVVELIETFLDSYILGNIDLLCVCDPEFPFEDDGVRDTNKDFQKEIHNMFMDYVHTLNINYPSINILHLKGNSNTRLKTIKDFIMLNEMGY